MENQPEKTNLPAAQTNFLEEVTPKNRLFLLGVIEGKKVFDAYRDAGYEGDAHAAYVLKARLNKELAAFALAHGVSREDLLVEIGKLNQLPVLAENVTINQKIRILALQDKVLQGMKPERPNITAITINRFEKTAETPPQEKIVETTVIPSSEGK